MIEERLYDWPKNEKIVLCISSDFFSLCRCNRFGLKSSLKQFGFGVKNLTRVSDSKKIDSGFKKEGGMNSAAFADLKEDEIVHRSIYEVAIQR